MGQNIGPCGAGNEAGVVASQLDKPEGVVAAIDDLMQDTKPLVGRRIGSQRKADVIDSVLQVTLGECLASQRDVFLWS